jgi:FMN phosphatase YigB (HAD superfamily)
MTNKKAVFFDLDGTLLPVDPDTMFGPYFELLKKSEIMQLIAADTEDAFRIFMEAASYMMENRGGDTNEGAFLAYIEKAAGRKREHLKEPLNRFYGTVFDFLTGVVQKKGIQRRIVHTVRQKGYKTVLATMPVFPLTAAVSRLSSVGLHPEDFHYISHYGNSTYLKPHPEYYQEILSKIHLDGKDCIMVGNNIKEDMVAQNLGFDVFLVTGHEIGEYKKDDYTSGDLRALFEWACGLPRAEV